MPERHPAAVLLGASLGLALAELATAGVLLGAWALLHGPWWSLELLGCAAAFGLGLGLVVGAGEVVARSRGLALGLAVLGLAWPLPALLGAFASLRLSPRPLGELEAIDLLRQVVTRPQGWGSGVALGTVALALYGPLLRARLRGDDAPGQACAMAWGALAWLALALALPAPWPAEEVELWVCLLLLAGRGAFTAPAQALSDRIAERLLAAARGERPATAAPPSRARWAGLLLGGPLACAVAVMPGVIAPGEGASLGVARFRAIFHRDARHALARRLVDFDPPLRGSRTRWLGPLDVVAWRRRLPDVDWQARDAESSRLLRDLALDGHPRAVAALADRPELRGPLTLDTLVERVRPAAERGDPVGMRALGALLVQRDAREAARWLERAAAGGDAQALVVLATRLRPRHAPATTALLRQALGASTDPFVRARAAAELEQAYEWWPAHRSSLDPRSDVLFVGPDGRPLDGAVTLELRRPDDELGRLSTRSAFVRRPLIRGRIPEGLVRGAQLEAAWYAWDLERAAAGICDGTAVMYVDPEPSVVEVRVKGGPYGPVSGRVLDLAGAPARDVVVALRSAVALDPTARRRIELRGLVTVTELDGSFAWPDLPPGDYQVGLPDADGLVEVADLVTVTLPGATPIELRRKPSLSLR